MKQTLLALIKKTRDTIQFRQRWDLEHPGEANHVQMHFLDGRLEALEEVLKLIVAEEVLK